MSKVWERLPQVLTSTSCTFWKSDRRHAAMRHLLERCPRIREGSGGRCSRIVALNGHQTLRPTVEEPTVSKRLVEVHDDPI
jgi:hypothetical protein